jgi:hypothetical protein
MSAPAGKTKLPAKAGETKNTKGNKMATANEIVLQVMQDVQAVGKKDRNQSQGFNFRGIDAVVNAVGPALRKAGGFIVPQVQDYEKTTIPAKNGGQLQVVRLTVEYSVYGTDGQPIQGVVVAEAFDSGDKATAKAMSVAYRTFLLQLLCLPTDEPDPDTFSYETAPAQPAMTQEQLNNIWDLVEGSTTKDELRKLWADNANVLDMTVTTPLGVKSLRALILARQAEVN